MPKTSLILASTSSMGDKLQKTITDVNPEATNAQLKELAQKLNALSTNIYGSTTRIDKTACDTEEGGGDPRPVPTLTLSADSISMSTQAGYINGQLTVTYSGDGMVYVRRATGCEGVFAGIYNQNGEIKLSTTKLSIDMNGGTLEVGAYETENYKSPMPVTITIV